MDNNTVLEFRSNSDAAQIHRVVCQLSDFMVKIEDLSEGFGKQLKSRERSLDKKLSEAMDTLDEKLEAFKELVAYHQELISTSNAARLRRDMENLMERLFGQGEDHVRALRELHTEVKGTVNASCERLDTVSVQAAAGISEALSSFRAEDFKLYTENSCRRIEKTSSLTVKRVSEIIKWFHWKNLGLSMLVGIAAAFTVSFYVNAEAPWETHQVVKQERLAGAALAKVWTQLSPNDQKVILQHMSDDSNVG